MCWLIISCIEKSFLSIGRACGCIEEDKTKRGYVSKNSSAYAGNDIYHSQHTDINNNVIGTGNNGIQNQKQCRGGSWS